VHRQTAAGQGVKTTISARSAAAAVASECPQPNGKPVSTGAKCTTQTHIHVLRAALAWQAHPLLFKAPASTISNS
jgi:hypothetical protein